MVKSIYIYIKYVSLKVKHSTSNTKYISSNLIHIFFKYFFCIIFKDYPNNLLLDKHIL